MGGRQRTTLFMIKEREQKAGSASKEEKGKKEEKRKGEK